jgi:hypothetical protein
LTVIGLTISGGQNVSFGGAILNDGTLTVVNSTLTSNHSDTQGGAIATLCGCHQLDAHQHHDQRQ